MSTQETDLDRLAEVQSRIRRAARDAGRNPAEVGLVCVSKTIGADRIQPLLTAGCRQFGENRVQEAAEKWPALRAAFPDLILRLIGPLQTNKVRDAVRLFDVIESLDRPKLAAEIAAQAVREGKRPRLLVQVNIGEESQKAGVMPADADGFIRHCRDDLGLSIEGLMCIPPVDHLASPYFAQLAAIAARNGLKHLSMGMTSDFEQAIKLGATEVRVGSAIFGAR
jgi:pyridoxal phosphate enzyme (YggS family)